MKVRRIDFKKKYQPKLRKKSNRRVDLFLLPEHLQLISFTHNFARKYLHYQDNIVLGNLDDEPTYYFNNSFRIKLES